MKRGPPPVYRSCAKAPGVSPSCSLASAGVSREFDTDLSSHGGLRLTTTRPTHNKRSCRPKLDTLDAWFRRFGHVGSALAHRQRGSWAYTMKARLELTKPRVPAAGLERRSPTTVVVDGVRDTETTVPSWKPEPIA